MGPTPEALTPTHRLLAKAPSVPRPLEAGAESSSIPDAEATNTAPAEWVREGGTGALNKAILDVQARLRAEPTLSSSATMRSWIREQPSGYVSHFFIFGF